MEFGPDPVSYTDNTWGCRCLNQDLYVDHPEHKYACRNTTTNVTTAIDETIPESSAGCADTEVKVLNDTNGKKCGVTSGCKISAVVQ